MRLTSLIAGETLIKPIKTTTYNYPFLYLNQGLIEIRKSKVAPCFRRAFLGVKVRLATAKRLDLDAQKCPTCYQLVVVITQ